MSASLTVRRERTAAPVPAVCAVALPETSAMPRSLSRTRSLVASRLTSKLGRQPSPKVTLPRPPSLPLARSVADSVARSRRRPEALAVSAMLRSDMPVVRSSTRPLRAWRLPPSCGWERVPANRRSAVSVPRTCCRSRAASAAAFARSIPPWTLPVSGASWRRSKAKGSRLKRSGTPASAWSGPLPRPVAVRFASSLSAWVRAVSRRSAAGVPLPAPPGWSWLTVRSRLAWGALVVPVSWRLPWAVPLSAGAPKDWRRPSGRDARRTSPRAEPLP